MQVDTTVRDVMVRDFVGVSESDSLAAAAELVVGEDADGAVVLRGNEQVGSLAAPDLLEAVLSGVDPETTPVSEVMDDPLPSVPADAAVTAIRDRLVGDARGRLLVKNGEGPVGVVSASELLASLPAESGFDVGAAGGFDRAPETEPGRTSPTQSVCEDCGSLSHELANVDGRLLCPDCTEA